MAHYLLITYSLPNPDCPLEENIGYDGGSGVSGLNEPRQPNAGSCRAYCTSTYPSSLYFNFVTPDYGWGPNTCWCKTSDSDKRAKIGVIAGEVKCGGECHDVLSYVLSNLLHLLPTFQRITLHGRSAKYLKFQ